jgi:transposase-like protein
MTVLEGLRGKPVAEICAEHQISPSLYYQWRDQFLANAGKAFEAQKRTRE